MKTTKKVLSFIICIIMLATSVYNEGWSSLLQSIEASAMAGHEQKYNDSRIELDFNKDWLFSLTDDDSAYLKGYDDSAWESIDLPHDFSMSQAFTTDGATEAENGQLPGGTGWYRKWFNLYEYHTSEHVFLNFDGAYQHTYVYVNGQLVGENHYGYNSFSFELSEYLICSNTSLNLIAVKVVNDQPNSRWYSGSGINRNVTLSVAGPVHVALYGPRLTTPDLADGDGTVNAKIKLHNDTAIAKKVKVEASVVEYSLHDDHHDPVSDTVVYINENTGKDTLTIPANTKLEITLKPKVKNPKLWSLDDPNLYKLKVVVKDEAGELIDEYHTTFGFRYTEWDADGGFKLNGESIKLKGVCLHHDQGALGAAQEYEAIYRQLVTLKEMGCNAIRTSHNSASKLVIQICNKLGILVVEEFFDGWDASKNYNENDFSKYFMEPLSEDNHAIGADGQKWFQYVVEHTILRDEHDPCIIAWDVGNELCNITDSSQTGNYETIVKSITNIVDTLDPSRVVLQGNNRPYRYDSANDPVTMIDGYMDVIGGNYNPSGWEYVKNDSSDPRSEKPFVATEAASAINSRGIYYTMGNDDINFQCTSYDTNAVSWGNTAAEAWYYVITNDWFSGEFIWTGFDYIGEPTPWNNGGDDNANAVPNSSYFGVVDTAGFEKDSYYLYRSWWNEDSTTLHLVPGSWNRSSLSITNGYVPVAVYSNAARIELLLNGEVIATATATDVASDGGRYTYKSWTESIVNSSKCAVGSFYTGLGADLYPQFSVRYEEGTLSVKAYDKNNNEITDTVGSTASVTGTATQIVSQVWDNRSTYTADGTDYVYIEYEARDAEGNFMNDYNGTLRIKVDDSSARYAEIVGVDNGNPATTEKYQQSSVLLSKSEAQIQMFNGKALVILRTTDEEGTINVTANASDASSSFSAQGVTVTSVSESGIKLSDELHEVIRQNENKYTPTLYDEYEIVKHQINKLEKPEGGSSSGGSGDSGEATKPGKYEIYLADPSATDGCIDEGYYIINSQNFVMSEELFDGWNVILDYNLFDKEMASEGAGYYYNSFTTTEDNLYEFIHQGGNQYYIRNVSTNKYLGYDKVNWMPIFDTAPHTFTIIAKENGSIQIFYEPIFYIDARNSSYFYGYNSENDPNAPEASYIWLYSEPSVQEIPDDYQIYLANNSDDGCVESGKYIIYNQNFVLGTKSYYEYATYGDYNIQDMVNAPSGSAYPYESFNVSSTNVLEFTHLGNNLYYIQNAATQKYLKIGSYSVTFDSEPQVVSISTNSDGSIIINNFSYYFIHYLNTDYYYAEHVDRIPNLNTNANVKMWLYSAPTTQQQDTSFKHYTATTDVNNPVANGDYAICNIQSGTSLLVTGTTSSATNGAAGLANADVSNVITSDYGKISQVDTGNIYTFTSQGNGKYYIMHKASGMYLSINYNNSVTLSETPMALNVTAINNGSEVRIYNDNNIFLDLFKDVGRVFSAWASSVTSTNANEDFRLYAAPVIEDEGGNESGDGNNTGSGDSGNVNGGSGKYDLYTALHAGIAEDFSIYTRESFEDLLTSLEDGVTAFNNPDATDSDYTAAAEAIYAAIEALELDIKKINGTLFKYGYDNRGGIPDYSDGGILMNDIAVRQMKQSILADANLVRQIKEIIGYDDSGWSGNQADEVLDGVAEAYARIYTLQFTGVPHTGSSITNAAYNGSYNEKNIAAFTNVPVSLWNLWTKNDTHGKNDPGTIHDGASVQGLASSTLNKGVVTSHAAYIDPLSYANDGPDNDHDIDNYVYGFSKGSEWKVVTLNYLEGISVYFPDLFTRENLDANGKVTTETTGQFAKYYWDAEFPIFITTDEYGVNTYKFDSKDTTYLVQSSFNDENQTVDMELNEVGSWAASGPNSGSGFFPFNYQQGTTTYTGENAIYHYGFTFEHNFYIPKGGKHANGEDVIFNFSGDDDVYVYIDGVLVLDNGGLHGAREVTINFTNCTINYQFAMDVTDGQLKAGEYEHTYSYSNIVEENEIAATYNADTIAALNKLHQVISDGQVHTLNFFYLERGASDSNCRMSFNLSETSEEVRIVDQVLTLDYGLPVEYNIKDNNNLSQAALDNNVTVEYLGLCAVNEEVETTYTFELPEIIVPFEDNQTYTIDGMKYGTCTIDKEGNTSYSINTMNMSESEHFYVCAKITGDPTYADNVVYYQIEKTTFVPATAIYYEDTFDTITYKNGKVPSNYNNTNNYGIWMTDGAQVTTLKQNADLTDSEANPYGYESSYTSFATYSGGSSHYVDVSTKNNPSSKYSGGSGAAWPTVDFTFTGTGFDLISVTDNTTGAFSVIVKNAAGQTVSSTVVDTFYGYSYGRIYSGDDGKPTLDSAFTPMYRKEDGTCTSAERYYDGNGAITETPHYYDAEGNVTKTVTDSPAYAYAYGWVIAEEGTTDTLYQIPVIKITDLEYGSYSVTITPTFTSVFGHSSTNADGTSYYRVYLDAIKIYSPAGEDEGITDKDVNNAYATDDERYPNYLELKNMLIGADSLSEADTQGVIFIDGIAALDNDIETYKNAGPNNELYLAKDQAVAFEIWATAVPTDIQIGTKLACGNPALTISYDAKSTELDIGTATDMYYSFNTELPNDGKLTWQLVKGADGNNYYTTGTVVIQNTGDEGSILSVTNMKWTFSQYGGKGYFRIPTSIKDEEVILTSTADTPYAAYSLMRMRTAALDIEQPAEPEIKADENGNSLISIKLNTSADVASLLITDANGNPIDTKDVEYIAKQLDGEDILEWTVTIAESDSGTYTYVVTGVYANGYTDTSKSVAVTVTVENTPQAEEPDNKPEDENDTQENTSQGSAFDTIRGIFNKFIDFMRAIFALFGVTL